MLRFVDITKETPIQEQDGYVLFGRQIALSTTPLDFQYESDEPVSSFIVVRKDRLNKTLETIDLNTDLISYDGSYHICNGQTDYSEALECGLYYFLVNGKYQSEDFEVLNAFDAPIPENEEISISGLYFYDFTSDISVFNKSGAFENSFAKEFATNLTPLKFQYKSNESVSSFKLIYVNRLNEIIDTIDLSTDLISSDGESHLCTGETNFSELMPDGICYFLVNDKYQSKLFQIFGLVYIVIENLTIDPVNAGSTSYISFDAFLSFGTGSMDLELTFEFSNGIESFSEVLTIYDTFHNYNIEFEIPLWVTGFTILTIKNTSCQFTINYQFIINAPCFELLNGNVFELLESGECRELL